MKTKLLILLLTLCSFATQAREPQRGYRGFADFDLYYFSEKTPGYSTSDYLYLSVSTSHGYQFNPHLYIGAGFTFGGDSMLPFYVNARIDWKFGKFTPFGDVKIGYNLTGGGGVFFSPSVGYRFNWGRKVGINLGIGLTVKGYQTEVYEIIENPDGYQVIEYAGTERRNRSYLTIRLGIDF